MQVGPTCHTSNPKPHHTSTTPHTTTAPLHHHTPTTGFQNWRRAQERDTQHAQNYSLATFRSGRLFVRARKRPRDSERKMRSDEDKVEILGSEEPFPRRSQKLKIYMSNYQSLWVSICLNNILIKKCTLCVQWILMDIVYIVDILDIMILCTVIFNRLWLDYPNPSIYDRWLAVCIINSDRSSK